MSNTLTVAQTNVITPQHTDFDNEGLVFLGNTVYNNEIFDMYVSQSTRFGAEILCAHETSHQCGPMAMAATECSIYQIGHPMYTAYHLAKAKGLA